MHTKPSPTSAIWLLILDDCVIGPTAGLELKHKHCRENLSFREKQRPEAIFVVLHYRKLNDFRPKEEKSMLAVTTLMWTLHVISLTTWQQGCMVQYTVGTQSTPDVVNQLTPYPQSSIIMMYSAHCRQPGEQLKPTKMTTNI